MSKDPRFDTAYEYATDAGVSIWRASIAGNDMCIEILDNAMETLHEAYDILLAIQQDIEKKTGETK